jgi:methionine-rich copper-binding protein CopC
MKSIGVCLSLGVAPFVATVCAPNLADAHAIVVRSNPKEGETVSAAIAKVEVWYDAPISSALAALSVTDPQGLRVDKRDAAIDRSDGAHVFTSFEAAKTREYTVLYRAISTDGHIVTGLYHFTVSGQ